MYRKNLLERLRERIEDYTSKHRDVSIRIKEIGGTRTHPIICLILFGFWGDNDPKEAMDNAVETIMKTENYADFTERYLDNPWMRIVITNFDKMCEDDKYVDSFKYQDCVVNKYKLASVSDLFYIHGGYNDSDPWNYMMFVVGECIKEGHNDCIETSLDNPWERIVITNFNDLPASL